jgi:hypothetical protein
VLRVLSDETERSSVVSSLREAGFSINSFASERKCREKVCSLLSRVEDTLEYVRGSLAHTRRVRIQALRRALECELFS